MVKAQSFLSLLLFLLGIGLLTTSGQTRLTCDRNIDLSVQCSRSQTTSLGVFQTSSETIRTLKSVKIDELVKRTYDIETDDSPPKSSRRKVYGVVLIGEKEVLLDAYDYDRDR